MVLEFFDKIEELISLLKQEEDNMRKAAHVVGFHPEIKLFVDLLGKLFHHAKIMSGKDDSCPI